MRESKLRDIHAFFSRWDASKRSLQHWQRLHHCYIFFILTDHIKCNLHEGFRGYDKRLRNPLLYSIGEMSSVFLFCVLRNDFEVAHFESSFIVVFSRFKPLQIYRLCVKLVVHFRMAACLSYANNLNKTFKWSIVTMRFHPKFFFDGAASSFLEALMGSFIIRGKCYTNIRSRLINSINMYISKTGVESSLCIFASRRNCNPSVFVCVCVWVLSV